MTKHQRGELSVKIVPFGPSQNVIDRISAGLMRNPTVQKYLGDARYRLLYFELVDSDAENNNKGKRKPLPLDRFRATMFDYTNNRTIFVDGSLNEPRRVKITESGIQPLPTNDEFNEAVKILTDNDKEIASAIREEQLHPYQTIPPLINTELPDGTIERTIAVELMPSTANGKEALVVEDRHQHEIVGVNMIRKEVIRFPNKASSMDCIQRCGPPNAGQPTTVRGTAGQVWVTISLDSTVLWRFLAIRPSASSGNMGSGIELRSVDYKGKRVLNRAHVPILNVKYDGDACSCGPYRDWQFQEGMIQADGSDVAPGFRRCPTPATTILDTGSDTGNFLGVAIYDQGPEVVLVSEMEAGWYRYISEWRFHDDGTIRPRFGFTAREHPCVCHVHHHHVYWRFDFDIGTPGNNRVREFNASRIGPIWRNINFETQRSRSPSTKRKWRVENISTGEGYDIIPGPTDGVATSSPDWPFPRGDLWILRYHGTPENDDGHRSVGPPCEADLHLFLNDEPINDSDVVIWYSGHFTHNFAHTRGHKLGPDLKPARPDLKPARPDIEPAPRVNPPAP